MVEENIKYPEILIAISKFVGKIEKEYEDEYGFTVDSMDIKELYYEIQTLVDMYIGIAKSRRR